MILRDYKFSLGYAEFEIPVELSSTKGHFWNSRDILRWRNLAASDVEVIMETTDGDGSTQGQC